MPELKRRVTCFNVTYCGCAATQNYFIASKENPSWMTTARMCFGSKSLQMTGALTDDQIYRHRISAVYVAMFPHSTHNKQQQLKDHCCRSFEQHVKTLANTLCV